IDVSVSDDHRMDRRLGLLAQHAGEHRTELRHTAVDQHDSLVGLEAGNAAETGLKERPLRDLDGATLPEKAGFFAALSSHGFEAVRCAACHSVSPTKIATLLGVLLLELQARAARSLRRPAVAPAPVLEGRASCRGFQRCRSPARPPNAG